jgi:hypothetical protein
MPEELREAIGLTIASGSGRLDERGQLCAKKVGQFDGPVAGDGIGLAALKDGLQFPEDGVHFRRIDGLGREELFQLDDRLGRLEVSRLGPGDQEFEDLLRSSRTAGSGDGPRVRWGHRRHDPGLGGRWLPLPAGANRSWFEWRQVNR